MMIRQHPVSTTDLSQISFIEASAGTGKTWTLSALYLRALLEQPVRVEQIVVMTFTTVAAAQLKQRIEQRLSLAAQGLVQISQGVPIGASVVKDDPFLVDYLPGVLAGDAEQAQLRLELALASSDQMQIGTINSVFQHWLMRGFGNNPYAAQLELMPSDAFAQREIIDAFLQQQFQAQPLLATWFAANPNAFDLGSHDSYGIMNQALKDPQIKTRYSGQTASQLLANWDAARRPCQQVSQSQWLAVFADLVKHADAKPIKVQKKHHQTWAVAVTEFFAQGATQLTESVHKGLLRLSWLLPDLFKTDVGMPTDNTVLLARQFCQLPELTKVLPLALAVELRQYGLERLAQLKRQRGQMTYDDQVHLLASALEQPDQGDQRAAQIKQLFPVALVDETQDTDHAMWSVLLKIYSGGGLVAVGDPKQSIYRFRGADVDAYLQAKERAQTVLNLSENQRSSETLIRAVNYLFSSPGAFVNSKIALTPASKGARPIVPLYKSATKVPGGAPLHIDLVVSGEKLSAPTRVEKSLAWTVEQVQIWLSQKRDDGSGLSPGQIAILVSTNVQAAAVKRALSTTGIAAVEASRTRVVDSDEANEWLLILAAASAIEDPTALTAAMATRLWGLQTDQLHLSNPTATLMQRGRNVLTEFAQAWRGRGAYFAMTQMLACLGARERLGCLVDGARRLTNIDHVIDMICNQPAASTSPAGARAWLEAVREQSELQSQAGDELELRLESDADLVQIQTVHKSKGLEFDVVLLPFAGHGRRALQQKSAPVRVINDATGAVELDFDPPATQPDPRLVSAVRAEHARLLYVALTRARNACEVLLFDQDLVHKEESTQDSDMIQLLKTHHDGTDTIALSSLLTQIQIKAKGSIAVGVWQSKMARPLAPMSSLAIEQAKQWIVAQAALAQSTVSQKYWPASWSLSSFTSIASAQASQSASALLTGTTQFGVRDHDDPALLRTVTSDNGEPTQTKLDGVRATFPVGRVDSAQAGVFLHEAFELQPFDKPFDRASLGKRALAFSLADDADGLVNWFNQVLAAPLSFLHGDALRNIEADAVFNELEFLMHTDTDAAQLARLLSNNLTALYEQPIGISASSLIKQGFVRGFIDSVFCHQGRWFVVDWKSNHLGSHWQDYRGERLRQAMLANQYGLQATLYAVALHRWLKSAQSGYHAADHFGGIAYLFMRGVGVSVAEPDTGVWFWSPEPEQLEQLDQGFGR
jgi:exodeoxyribonuclease V beta subunit